MPCAAQLDFVVASSRMSAKPIGLRGQPTLGRAAPTSRSRPASSPATGSRPRRTRVSASWLSSRPHRDDAGDQTCGFICPRTILVWMSPELAGTPVTKIGRPSYLVPLRVEPRDQRAEHVLEVRRVRERESHRVGGRTHRRRDPRRLDPRGSCNTRCRRRRPRGGRAGPVLRASTADVTRPPAFCQAPTDPSLDRGVFTSTPDLTGILRPRCFAAAHRGWT